ncbi:MAG: peptidoglycan editing factor PgeF [Balneolaceae bacterium]|nr:peptidoglycan editing factor PgeF [Balneolaceae bacterium]
MKRSGPDIDLILPRWASRDGTGDPRDGEGVTAFFTTRNTGWNAGGDEAAVSGLNLGLNTADPPERVHRNRERLFEALALDPEWVALAGQVHGTHVRCVSAGGTYPETDGLVTRVPGLALGIQVADCAAVLLWEPAARVVGAVHAGWRGAAGGILPRALEVMKGEGGDPEKMHAFVSPCLSQARFEVGEEVAEQFPEDFVDRESHRKPHLDLKGFLLQELADAGMDPSRVEVHPGCTLTNQKYYSWRRQGEQSGRMMGVVGLAS